MNLFKKIIYFIPAMMMGVLIVDHLKSIIKLKRVIEEVIKK